MKTKEITCDIAEDILALKSEESSIGSRIEDLKDQLVAANTDLIKMEDTLTRRKHACIKVHSKLNKATKTVESFTNDLLHYVELDTLSLEDQVKVLSALRFARKLRRALIDKKTMVNSAFYEINQKSLGGASPIPYEANVKRLSADRAYRPKYMSLYDVLSGNYLNENITYGLNSD